MRIKNVISAGFVLFIAFLTVCLTGCKKDNKIDYDNKIKVTYMLEGGEYKNCTAPLIQYYDAPKNNRLYLHNPTDFVVDYENIFIKSNYEFVGWYKTKTETSDGVPTYSDEWDFDKDTLTDKELTLYAKWVEKKEFFYAVCYYDDNGKEVELGKYPTSQGGQFNDRDNYAKRRDGYTPIGFYDEDGNEWNTNFKHPGGDEDLIIKVFVKYVKGDFAIVRTASELKMNKNRNIYLMNDIDLEGASFSFNNYNHIFEGNNHTISNFKVAYDSTRNGLIDDFEDDTKKMLCISVFGNIKNATIRNVNFENVHYEIEVILSLTDTIYLGGICVSMTDSTISNVNFSADYVIKKLPNDFNVEEDLKVATDNVYYQKDTSSEVSNAKCDIIKLEN